jgi:hypothetical protein
MDNKITNNTRGVRIMTTKAMTTTRSIKAFREKMKLGISLVADASRIYVDAIDKEPGAKAKFMAACPDVPRLAWRGFEQVGRGLIDQRLLYGGGNAQAELRRLPVSTQKEVLDKGVKLLTKRGDHMMVKVENLTTAQKAQVFDKHSVRDLAAQRAWQEDRQRSIVVENETPAYEVKRGRLVIYKACQISKQELAHLLTEVV